MHFPPASLIHPHLQKTVMYHSRSGGLRKTEFIAVCTAASQGARIAFSTVPVTPEFQNHLLAILSVARSQTQDPHQASRRELLSLPVLISHLSETLTWACCSWDPLWTVSTSGAPGIESRDKGRSSHQTRQLNQNNSRRRRRNKTGHLGGPRDIRRKMKLSNLEQVLANEKDWERQAHCSHQTVGGSGRGRQGTRKAFWSLGIAGHRAYWTSWKGDRCASQTGARGSRALELRRPSWKLCPVFSGGRWL